MISISNLLTPSLISGVIFLIFLQKWLSRTASTPQQRLPPSPRKLPLIGNLHQLGALPHRSLHSLSKHYNGGLMLLHLGNVPLLVASSSDAAREILKNQDLIFANRPKLSIPDKLFYSSRDVGFSPYGEYWRQMRSICMLQLLGKKRVQSFRSVREEETSLMVERIRQSVSLSSSVVNLSNVFASLSNDVICRVALGRKYIDQGKMFSKLLREFIELLGATSVRDYIPWLAWIDRFSGLDSKANRVFKAFDEFLNGLIEEHRRNRLQGGQEQLDFADILLDLQTDEKENSLLEHDSIKAVILDMFAAGSETIYTVLVWTMAELVRNPKKMKILQREVREIARDKDGITEDDLHQMRYLRAVIKESLRLHPPAPLLAPHESTEHTKVLGYDIPKGTMVMVNAWAIGRDPLAWENPEKFCPERFLDSDLDYRGHHFELIPFGSGRRMCPGMMFAEHLVELALAKLVHEFDFALPDGESVDDLDMSEGQGITVHKRLPLVLVATPRTL